MDRVIKIHGFSIDQKKVAAQLEPRRIEKAEKTFRLTKSYGVNGEKVITTSGETSRSKS